MADSPEYFPASHSVQVSDLPVEDLPALQLRQLDEPWGLYVPAEHEEQLLHFTPSPGLQA
jgi:hypothetical protein